jgi:hypothetical protein
VGRGLYRRRDTRSTYDVVQRSFAQAGPDVLAARAEFLGKVFHDQGITFDHAGEERPFPLDIVPRIVTADAWSVVERGVAQWWVGDWWAYDPTNDAVPGTGHVVARGRDYGDLTPVRGTYHGGDGGSAAVRVEVTRLR